MKKLIRVQKDQTTARLLLMEALVNLRLNYPLKTNALPKLL